MGAKRAYTPFKANTVIGGVRICTPLIAATARQTNYDVKCANCHRTYRLSHTAIQRRIRRGTDRCKDCYEWKSTRACKASVNPMPSTRWWECPSNE